MAKSTATHFDLRQTLAEELIKRIAEGTASWQKPWDPSQGDNTPINAVTGKPYRGINREWLLIFGPCNGDGRFCTYKQAQSQGWQVRKGSHGFPVEKWTTLEQTNIDEDTGAISTNRRMLARHYTVFHASQIDGIPPLEAKKTEFQIEPDRRVDDLIAALGVTLGHGGNRAFYRPSDDHIQMPPLSVFHCAADYDTVRLHEAAHATGHGSRLRRDLSGSFGSPEYAAEELRAEIAASMSARLLGIAFEPNAVERTERSIEGIDNTAAYLLSWLNRLPERDRNRQLLQAIAEAQKISDYLLNPIADEEAESVEESATLLVA